MKNEEKIIAILEQLVLKVDKLDVGQAKLEEGQAKLEQRQDSVEGSLADVKESLTDLRRHVILMENDNKLKFGGLFDGQKMLIDFAYEAREDISQIKNVLEMHDLRIKAVDSKIRKTS